MGLCQGRVFEQYLCCSVIPFVRINDVKKALNRLPFNKTAKLVQFKKKSCRHSEGAVGQNFNFATAEKFAKSAESIGL